MDAQTPIHSKKKISDEQIYYVREALSQVKTAIRQNDLCSALSCATVLEDMLTWLFSNERTAAKTEILRDMLHYIHGEADQRIG
jgi:hypothetical protein